MRKIFRFLQNLKFHKNMTAVFAVLLAAQLVHSNDMQPIYDGGDSSGSLYTKCVVVEADDEMTINRLRTFYNWAILRKRVVHDLNAREAKLTNTSVFLRDELIQNAAAVLNDKTTSLIQKQNAQLFLDTIRHAKKVRFSLNQEQAYVDEFLKTEWLEVGRCYRLREYVESIMHQRPF